MNILLVEDDFESANIIGTMLEKEEHVVIHLASAQSAIAFLNSYTPDRIITDIMMPNMDGFEFVKTIKGINKLAKIPVIFLTSVYDDVVNAIEGFNIGAVSYLIKPVEKAKLIEALDRTGP